MGDKQGARLIRLLYARAYELPRVWKALGLGDFLDEKERKRCPGYTAESMAAEDAAEAAAAHGESRKGEAFPLHSCLAPRKGPPFA